MVTINRRTVTVEGPKGTLTRDFSHFMFSLIHNEEERKITVRLYFGKRKTVANVGTVLSTIRNMITGVTVLYRYKMNIVFAHFPIGVHIADDQKTVQIKHYLGQKSTKTIQAVGGCIVYIPKEADATGKVVPKKDEILIEGTDKVAVGTTCSLIHGATLARGKDIRKFLDGIYIAKRGLVPVSN